MNKKGFGMQISKIWGKIYKELRIYVLFIGITSMGVSVITLQAPAPSIGKAKVKAKAVGKAKIEGQKFFEAQKAQQHAEQTSSGVLHNTGSGPLGSGGASGAPFQSVGVKASSLKLQKSLVAEPHNTKSLSLSAQQSVSGQHVAGKQPLIEVRQAESLYAEPSVT